MDFADQQPEALILGVLTRPLPLNFAIFEQKKVAFGAWSFQFSVIGESHWVEIQHEGQLVLHEILACTPLEPACCLYYHPCPHLAAVDFKHQHYQVQLLFETALTTPEHGSDEESLRVEFPSPSGITPLTYITWQYHAQTMNWQTLHTYPRGAGVVCAKTSSSFHCVEESL